MTKRQYGIDQLAYVRGRIEASPRIIARIDDEMKMLRRQRANFVREGKAWKRILRRMERGHPQAW